ncbi:MAG: LysR family transcriptional regulator [Oscillospiraceae bacterium]|nr:LysR family transcriptional regulator [Oscillospiraceae bacterium]
MNSTQLKCFIEAAERLNFTAAAEKLYISQPALSRNIAALEEELGVMLFLRKNNVLSLTPGGEVLYAWITESRTAFQQKLREAKKANALGHNRLVLGFVNNEILSEHDSKTIALFRTKHPEVELTIVHSPAREIVRHLTEQRMDIAVMIGTAAYGNPRLQYLESAHYRRCVAVSIAHPLAGKDQVSLKDFADDTFLSLREDVSTLSGTVREVCAEAGFTPRITELDDISEVISGIESGKGVALLMDNHSAAFNPLLKMVHIREFFPVSLICVWDSLNANPSIEEYLEIYKSIE